VKQTKNTSRSAQKAPIRRSSGTKVYQSKSTSSGRFSKVHLLILVVIFAIIGAVYTFASHAATGDGSIGVYRLFQTASGEHLLTTSEVEKNALVPKAGFSSDGYGFFAWADANNGRKPVFRVAGPGATGKHLLTMSVVEKDALVKGGWKLEGTGFYAYETAGTGRIPAYRVSYKNGDHLITTSGFERDDLVKAGWGNEGIAFYVSDGSSAPAQNTHPPTGGLDPSSCSTLAGWALDGDNLGAAVRVDAYVQGIGIASGATSINRPDITRIFYAAGNHGYNITIPAKWLDGKPHGADIYAINLDSKGKTGGDNNTKIGHREFACDASGKDKMPEILAQRAAEEAAAAKKAAEAAAAAAAAAKAAQASNPGAPNWPSTPGAVPLGRGSTGLGVLGLQTKLGKVGFWLAADGNFGATTEYAVKAFQIEIGLPFNGIADGQTQEVLTRAVNDGWRFNPSDPLLSNIPPIGSVNPTPTPSPTPPPPPVVPAPSEPKPDGIINAFLPGQCVATLHRNGVELGNGLGLATPSQCKTKLYFLRFTQPAGTSYDYATWISPVSGVPYRIE
jgi:hypothetical protein